VSATENDGDIRLRLANAVPGLVAYVDRDQRVTYLSDRFQDWFGTPSQQVQGRPLREVLGEAAYEQVSAQAELALAGCAVSFEAVLPRPGGPPRPVRASFTADVGPDGAVRAAAAAAGAGKPARGGDGVGGGGHLPLRQPRGGGHVRIPARGAGR
jgi:PAS domain-containing protein